MQIRPKKEVVSMLESKFSVFHLNGFIIKASDPGNSPEVTFTTPVSLTNDSTQLKQRRNSTWKREKKKMFTSLMSKSSHAHQLIFGFSKPRSLPMSSKIHKGSKKIPICKSQIEAMMRNSFKIFPIIFAVLFPL